MTKRYTVKDLRKPDPGCWYCAVAKSNALSMQKQGLWNEDTVNAFKARVDVRHEQGTCGSNEPI